MKVRGEYMSYEFFVIIEEDEDGWLVGSVPSLKGCHTQAKNLPNLLKRIKEAIRLCIKAEKKVSKPLKFIGFQEVKVAV